MLYYTPSQPKQQSFIEKADDLKKLKELLDSGAITEEEFNNQKSSILS